MRLVAIVERHGEVIALPLLIRSWFPDVQIGRPIWIQRERFLRDPALRHRVLELARRADPDAVLVLLDAHGEQASIDREAIGSSMRGVLGPCPHAFVLAVQEFEAWFLAAGTTIGLPEDTPDAEDVQGAKERLKRMLGRYRPTADQPSLTRALADAWPDLEGARRAPSRVRLYEELERIIGQARG